MDCKDAFSVVRDRAMAAVRCHSCYVFQWHQVHLQKRFTPEQVGSEALHHLHFLHSLHTVGQSQSTQNTFLQLKNRPENEKS